MGCFYTGFNYRNRKNGCFKIGETSKKTPAQRLSSIRSQEPFQCLGYLELIEETKSQRLFVESYVRMNLEKNIKYLKLSGNDHYCYAIKGDKYIQAQTIANQALELARQACEQIKIKYKIGTKVYKRG